MKVETFTSVLRVLGRMSAHFRRSAPWPCDPGQLFFAVRPFAGRLLLQRCRTAAYPQQARRCTEEEGDKEEAPGICLQMLCESVLVH